MFVRIRNFQSLQLVELDVQGLTVVLGPSNLGKSALVRAISSAFYGSPGDDFVRRGASETSVEILNAPKIGGGYFSVEWRKGKGVNRFVIDGVTYDKVARDVPVHLPTYGYHEIQVGEEYLRPQISEQFDRMFLLDRPGSFIHDVIAQASRLSVLLRADRSCSSDLKRQKSLKSIRQSDLTSAQVKLEAMSPIGAFHVRIQELKVKFNKLKTLSNSLDDIRSMHKERKSLLEFSFISLPIVVTVPEDLGQRYLMVRDLSKEKNLYSSLPEIVPSYKEYDFDGIEQLMRSVVEAKKLAIERKVALSEYRDSQSAFKSITQELEKSEADLSIILSSLSICPVCERPMPKKETLDEARVSE